MPFARISLRRGKPRDAATKQAFYRRLAELLADSPGLRAEDLMVIVQTTDYADWSFSNGIAAPQAEPGASS
ncbi:tautomerase family protein [Massilia pinisoli]|uniref:Tautomerase family protein n=1 Tax=Massilia pinisoli TaxID=1772194 RepID=A0ABT1ZSH2_9BURK|nr:tautomerase family protein [Massilia pinisoli]MCS0582865.1 tautomerase family protein [Massilia pinisoli]